MARPPGLSDNNMLPVAHAERVGDVLLNKIIEKYERLAPKVKGTRSGHFHLLGEQHVLGALHTSNILTLSCVLGALHTPTF